MDNLPIIDMLVCRLITVRSFYLGDDQIKPLASLKSKEDLIGDVLVLLQSPIKNVLGSLQSGGSTLSGLLKALEARGE